MQTRDLLTEKRLHQLGEMVALISPDELKDKQFKGELFKLVDVSDASAFAQGHIDGAVNMPLKELVETASAHFKKFQQIVLYHHDATSSVSTVAARQLQQAGFSNILVLQGGSQNWKESGHSLVSDDQQLEAD